MPFLSKFDILYQQSRVREHSSAGRASALQAGGHRFEPYCSHQTPFANHLCGNGSVVERCLAKANVASSNLVSRSIFLLRAFLLVVWRHSQVVRHGSAKPLSPVRIWVAPPNNAEVAKLADARDLKSLDGNIVPVQIRSPAPKKQIVRFLPDDFLIFLCRIVKGLTLKLFVKILNYGVKNLFARGFSELCNKKRGVGDVSFTEKPRSIRNRFSFIKNVYSKLFINSF